MLNDSFFLTFLGRLASISPTLIVCIIGIVMLASRELSKKARICGSIGLVLIAIGPVLGVLYGLWLHDFMSAHSNYASSRFSSLQTVYMLIAQSIHVTALILLIMAICHKEQNSTAKNETQNPYG